MKEMTFLTNTRHISTLGIDPVLRASMKTGKPLIISIMSTEGEYRIENEIKLNPIEGFRRMNSKTSMLDVKDLIDNRDVINVIKPMQVEYEDPFTKEKVYFDVEYADKFDTGLSNTITYCDYNVYSSSTYEQLVWNCVNR